MKKAGRNDPCPCGSGKKFKKCCEALSARGRFSATRITPAIQKTAALTTLFQTHLSTTPRKPLTEAPAPLSFQAELGAPVPLPQS